MVLPEGFGLPPLPYLLPLVVAVAALAGALYRTAAVSDRTVLALAPWVLVGSSLHVLYVLDWAPASVQPLLGTPAVYLTTFVAAGAVWLGLAVANRPVERPLAALGGFAALALVALTFWLAGARNPGGLRLLWPAVGLVVAVLLAFAFWVATNETWPDVATVTGGLGALVLFAHALDAVSTAIGVDVLGFGERTPVSELVLDLAAGLPTADVIGVGWLFVLVKLVIAEAVVVLFADLVREDPAQGYLLLGVVAAVGLGPGAHNLLLFAVTG